MNFKYLKYLIYEVLSIIIIIIFKKNGNIKLKLIQPPLYHPILFN